MGDKSTERSRQPKANGTEIEEEKRKEMTEAAMGAGALAVAGLIAWGVSSLFSSGTSSENKKVMKAPGKNGTTMFRDDFESNPKDYFKRLRD